MRMVLVAAAATGWACGITDVSNTDHEASEPFVFDVPAASLEGLELTGINGRVTVTGVPGAGSVTVEGWRRVRSASVRDAREHLEVLDVDVQTVGTALVVRTEQPSHTAGRTYEVDYDVRVPADLLVDLENVNGVVTVIDVDGDLRVSNVNGEAQLEGVGATLIRVTVVNGLIAGDLAAANEAADVRMETTNGRIALAIPVGSSYDVDARVANGVVTVSNLTLTNVVQSATWLRGRVGTGDGLLYLRTVNGDIQLAGW